MNCTRRTYFKAIVSSKKTQWSDFLSSATPHSVWTAKRFAFGHPPQHFPALPEANSTTQVPEALLVHFFPPRFPPAPPSHCHDTKTTAPLPEGKYLELTPAPQTPLPLAPTISHIWSGSTFTISDLPSFLPSWTLS